MPLPNLLDSHYDTLEITVSLATPASAVAAFDGIILVDTTTNSSQAGADSAVTVGTNSKYVELGAVSEATAANTDTAGSFGTAILQDLADVFGHAWSPSTVGVLSLGSSDAYLDVFADLDNAGYNGWYCAVPVTHSLALIGDIANGVAATASTSRKRIVVAQTSASAAYGSSGTWTAARVDSTPAALAETVLDRLFFCYNSADTEGMAGAVATRALSQDPDTVSAPWTFPVPSIARMAWPSGVTITTAKNNLRTNNVNVALPLGGTNVWLDPGTSQTGRPMYVVVSADWFEARLRESVADMKVLYGDLSLKFPLSRTGQNAILGLIEGIYTRGVLAGHFLSRDEAAAQGLKVRIEAIAITPTDRANRRMRFLVEIPVLLDGRIITIGVTITS